MTTPVGQITGAKTKVLDGGVAGGYTWLRIVNYYDDKYRLIQAVGDNYKGGTDRSSKLFDFTGRLLQERITHQQSDVVRRKDMVAASVIGNKITRTNAGSSWGNSGLASADFFACQQRWLGRVYSNRRKYKPDVGRFNQ